jgi:hypothetical protein
MLMAKAQDHPAANTLELGGFESAQGGPDVRGWDVIGRDGRRIGEVDDVLVETDNRETFYLAVRLDDQPPTPTTGEAVRRARPTGTLDGRPGDLEHAAIPELDSLAQRDELIGQATVPGVTAPETPARTVGEALVRDSLLDVENRLTAGEHPGWNRLGRRALVPLHQAHLEPGERRVRVDQVG